MENKLHKLWVARDKDGDNLWLFNTNEPVRSPHYDTETDTYNEDVYDNWICGQGDGIEDYNSMYDLIQLPKSMFKYLNWDTGAKQVTLQVVEDKSDPTKFESCGNHLRNLLGPYQALIDLVKMFKNGDINEATFNKLADISHFESSINDIIEFSKNDKLEDVNWR